MDRLPESVDLRGGGTDRLERLDVGDESADFGVWIIGEDLILCQLKPTRIRVSVFSEGTTIITFLLRSGPSYEDNQFGVFRDAVDCLEA